MSSLSSLLITQLPALQTLVALSCTLPSTASTGEREAKGLRLCRLPPEVQAAPSCTAV